ncbi:MAG TPA: hypothetical protein VN700_03790 [Vicinamibacterales bacterium]|nr:hypothetical protein [Vicinamibacterales bacterium]
MIDNWGQVILAAGALGVAAFGIVEGLKWIPAVGEAGFPAIRRLLGDALWQALLAAYGAQVEPMLRAQYRGDQENFGKTLRQGLRIGLTPANAEAIARALGVVDPRSLKEAAAAVDSGAVLTPEQRNALARFELAADARVDAALALAQDHYARFAKILAGVIAVILAVAAAIGLDRSGGLVGRGLLIGLAAVPLAPIAKDVASALQAAKEALRARS